jgi:precorrin-6B methylase 2
VDIVDRLLRDKPIFHVHGTAQWDASPDTLRAIQRTVRDGSRTLEIGCGASTVVFVAAGARHTAISIEADEHERVRAYLRTIGVDDANFHSFVGWSDHILPAFDLKPRSLDIALIDGAHGFPYPIIDWHFVSAALKVGGKLLLDDIPIPAVACVFRFMRADLHWQLYQILENRTAVFTLLREPIVEAGELTDWTKQPFNNHWDYGFAPLSEQMRIKARSLLRRVAAIHARLKHLVSPSH